MARFLLMLAVGVCLAMPAAALERNVDEGAPVPTITFNFNLGSEPADQSFPENVNNQRAPTETLAKVLGKSNDFICFGSDCTCKSVARKKAASQD
jgi:hypothetical protein